MLSICKQFEFHAAHHLPDHEGKCKQIHGHTYRLEIEVGGPKQSSGPERGMIVDFGKIKEVVHRCIIDELDHTDLNLRWANPTAEEMVDSFSYQLYEAFFRQFGTDVVLLRISLWETSDSCATWRADL